MNQRKNLRFFITRFKILQKLREQQYYEIEKQIKEAEEYRRQSHENSTFSENNKSITTSQENHALNPHTESLAIDFTK